LISIYDLGINLNKKELITIVGAGGKTSIMFKIAEKLAKIEKKVLITTTTKIFKPNKKNVKVYLGEAENLKCFNDDVVVAGSKIIEKSKIKGYSNSDIDNIFSKQIFDYILVEGDGARRKSIKAPRENEPIVPSNTNILIGIIGMDSYGKNINEDNVFGLNEFLRITGKQKHEQIDINDIIELITNSEGLFKYRSKKNILILNKINIYNLNASNKIKTNIEKNYNDVINRVIKVEEL
jgi:probable selenium-dependent hydroxylase accessory protein YqeC